MPRTSITPVTPIGPYPTLQPAANSLDVTLTAGDATNLNQIAWGTAARMLVLFQNTGAGARTFTVTSKADSLNRTGDITAYSLGAGEFGALVLERNGWRQDDGNLYVTVEHAEVKVLAFLIN